MRKTIDKTIMDIFLILILAKTSEEKGTGLPLAGMTTLYYSRHSISNPFHDLYISTRHKCSQRLDC